MTDASEVTLTDTTEDAPLNGASIELHKYWTTLGVVLGYNELAKLATKLGEKVYFRLSRDNALQEFVKLGGNPDMFKVEDAVISIEVDKTMPHIVFRERDVELMREYVALYDKGISK